MPTLGRILVTGGGGLVGSAVVTHLLEAGHPVTLLSRSDSETRDGVRVVRGDARDIDAVTEALDGVDAVAHLAAIPTPDDDPAPIVFGNNTLATFTVLWTAAELGVRRLVIASSVNAIGLFMNPHRPLPAGIPIDERTPSDIADPYSLSKQTDEATLRAVCRRFEASGVALRLPLMVSAANAAGLRAWATEHAATGVGDGWGWLDVRDGAEAFRLALTADYAGAHTLYVAADTTFQDMSTPELLARFAPGVPVTGSFPGRAGIIDTSRARELLAFRPRYDTPGAEV